MATDKELDQFTRSYIEALLWSSTVDPFDECPECGEVAVLCRWDESGECVCRECSDREPHYEPSADENYDADDFTPEALEKIRKDCQEFLAQCGIDFDGSHYIGTGTSPEIVQAGHDFCLNRNGHGCGFWDGDWSSDCADSLSRLSKKFGESTLYVGDDGKLYVSPM